MVPYTHVYLKHNSRIPVHHASEVSLGLAMVFSVSGWLWYDTRPSTLLCKAASGSASSPLGQGRSVVHRSHRHCRIVPSARAAEESPLGVPLGS
ncbi:hypothetical protein AB1N83_007658 [Pleurotus pulmonarius]